MEASSSKTVATDDSRSKSSDLHTYSREPYENEPSHHGGRKLFYCKGCAYSTAIHTNFRRHLLRRHDIDCAAVGSRTKRVADGQLVQLYKEVERSGIDTYEFDSKVLKRNIQEQAFQEALMRLITVHNLPHDIVEWPEFRALCAAVNPESLHILPTASEVSAKIDQAKDKTEGGRGAGAVVTGAKSDGTEAMLRSLDGLDLRDDDKSVDSEGTTDSCVDVSEDAGVHSVGDRST
ncbi:MAG: hypothetical protein M1822_003473 [Bathelium mastoideum]|nr:MAG: hypothetical protein M1822_003473 [Bathelium mastoideum]